MSLQGTSRTVGLPELFSILVNHKLTGYLVIASKEAERCLGLHKGEVVFSILNDPGESLGEIMKRELGADELALSELFTMTSEREFIGEELVSRGMVSESNLKEVLSRQIRRSLREIVRWPEWCFLFHPVDESQAVFPTLRVQTQSLVLDLARELDEWNSVGEILFDLDAIPVRTTGSLMMRKIGDWPKELPPPGKILATIEGRKSIRRILEESPYPICQLAQALAQLIEGKMIELTPGTICAEPSFALLSPYLPENMEPALELDGSTRDSVEDLRWLFLSDPLLAARALKLAGLYQSSESSECDMDQILTRLGPTSTETLILAENARRLFFGKSAQSWRPIFQQWSKVGRLAELIALNCGQVDPQTARLAGILHDIGRLALAGISASRYEALLELPAQSNELLEEERQVFGRDHCRVGSQVAEAWGFPSSIRSVVRDHHSPLEHPGNPLLGTVRAAIVGMQGPRNGIKLSKVMRKVLKNLGLTQSELIELRAQVEEVGSREEISAYTA